MTKDAWIARLVKPLTKKEAENLARTALNEHAITKLLDLCFHKQEIAFRASWILETSFESLDLIKDSEILHFLNSYKRQQNQSCQRHFTKIFMQLSHKRNSPRLIGCIAPAIDGNLPATPEQSLKELLETTFEWLIDPDTPVAVKVNCIDILFNFKNYADWVKDELKCQIEFLLKTGSAAMQSRGGRVLRRLR